MKLLNKMNQDFLKNAKRQLERDEGRRGRPYRDSRGIWTIGVGHNLEDEPLPDDIIDKLLVHDIVQAVDNAFQIFGVSEFESYGQARQLAIINMLFNLGKPEFLEFRRMIAAIRTRQWEFAAYHAKDSVWYTQVGDRADRVIHMLETNEIIY